MQASDVAGLLVLLGVVGVLAAIIGSGLEAGPVKFPSIPGSRQKPLALASVLVVIGGIAWWAVLQHTPADQASATTKRSAGGVLHIVLVPTSGHLRLGETVTVTSSVSDSDAGLGPGQCAMSWRDEVRGKTVRSDTTACNGTFTEPNAAPSGTHHISVGAEGFAGASGRGSRSVDVEVAG